VHVRVVDDLSGEEYAAIGEFLHRFVGVLHRTVDPVTEPELLRQPDRQVACFQDSVGVTKPVDQRAVVVAMEGPSDGALQAESALIVVVASQSHAPPAIACQLVMVARWARFMILRSLTAGMPALSRSALC